MPNRSAGGPAPTAPEVRDLFARWAAGVTVLAVRHERGISALTVSAFAPLSLEPPLVVACVGGDAPVLSYVDDARRFTVSVLAADQRGVAARFADRVTLPGEHFAPEGDPVIRNALACLTCVLESIHPGGDHAIVVGHVVALEASRQGAGPLVYYDRDYRTLR